MAFPLRGGERPIVVDSHGAVEAMLGRPKRGLKQGVLLAVATSADRD